MLPQLHQALRRVLCLPRRHQRHVQRPPWQRGGGCAPCSRCVAASARPEPLISPSAHGSTLLYLPLPKRLLVLLVLLVPPASLLPALALHGEVGGAGRQGAALPLVLGRSGQEFGRAAVVQAAPGGHWRLNQLRGLNLCHSRETSSCSAARGVTDSPFFFLLLLLRSVHLCPPTPLGLLALAREALLKQELLSQARSLACCSRRLGGLSRVRRLKVPVEGDGARLFHVGEQVRFSARLQQTQQLWRLGQSGWRKERPGKGEGRARRPTSFPSSPRNSTLSAV